MLVGEEEGLALGELDVGDGEGDGASLATMIVTVAVLSTRVSAAGRVVITWPALRLASVET